jgi:hypothetical protein
VLLLAFALAAPGVAAGAGESTSGYNQTPVAPQSGTSPTKETSTPTTSTSKEEPAKASSTTPTGTSSSAKASTLPFTGFDLRWSVAIGVLLIGAGFSIVVIQRRAHRGRSR